MESNKEKLPSRERPRPDNTDVKRKLGEIAIKGTTKDQKKGK